MHRATSATSWSRPTATPGGTSATTAPTSIRSGATSSTRGPQPFRCPMRTCSVTTARATGIPVAAAATSRPTPRSPRSSSRTRCRRSSRKCRCRANRRRSPSRTSSAGGRGCRPTTAGWSTSAPTHPAVARVSCRSRCTTSRHRWPKSGGRTRPVCGAVCCCRAPRRAPVCRSCSTRATSRCGRCARSSPCR